MTTNRSFGSTPVAEAINAALHALVDQQEYLTTRQAAHYTGLSKPFLDIARHRGDGPPYSKLGHAVRYKRSVLDEWMLARQRTKTR